MNMSERAKRSLGKAVSVSTKSGNNHEGVIEKVDEDGEICLKATFGPNIYIVAEQVESISVH